ncbi:DUF3093 domain-containing protein [Nocardioides sp. C4-1]|uniref:DUF3093 domain-containing protein n=1 Tax=Nocardioides sp. C4-1 TaxID=3151851 RepID=UPI003264A241
MVTAYDERLHVPLRWWVQGSMLVISLFLALVVATPAALAFSVTAVCLLMLVGALRSYGAARVVVADGVLRVGRAQIEARHLGDAEPLDAEQTRRAAGVEADARAFLMLRPYLSRAVKVAVTDPADPAPYWLVSTRHPDELADVVRTMTRS